MSSPTSTSLALLGSKEIAYPLVSLLPESNIPPPPNTGVTPISTPAPAPSHHPYTSTTSTPLYGSTSLASTPLGHCPAASEQVKLALVSLGNHITRQQKNEIIVPNIILFSSYYVKVHMYLEYDSNAV